MKKMISCVILLLSGIHILFKITAPLDFLEAEWSAGDLITFIGTIFLGSLAIWQNNRITALEEKAQMKNEICNIMLRPKHKSDSSGSYAELSNELKDGYAASTTKLFFKAENYSEAFLQKIKVSFWTGVGDTRVEFESSFTLAKGEEVRKYILCLRKLTRQT